MISFLTFFFSQLLAYFLVTANYRAIAQGRYFWTAITDLLYATVQFYLIKKIADSKQTGVALVGYVSGGVVGSLTAIWLTKLIFGY